MTIPSELILIKGSQQQFEIYLHDENDLAYPLAGIAFASVVIKPSISEPAIIAFDSTAGLTIDTQNSKLICNTSHDITWTGISAGTYIADVLLRDGSDVELISDRFNVKILEAVNA